MMGYASTLHPSYGALVRDDDRIRVTLRELGVDEAHLQAIEAKSADQVISLRGHVFLWCAAPGDSGWIAAIPRRCIDGDQA